MIQELLLVAALLLAITPPAASDTKLLRSLLLLNTRVAIAVLFNNQQLYKFLLSH